jgi:hypothetical protein
MRVALRRWVTAALVAVGVAMLATAGALLVTDTSTGDGAPCGSVLRPQPVPIIAVLGGDSVYQQQDCSGKRQNREVAAILTGVGGLAVLGTGILVGTTRA